MTFLKTLIVLSLLNFGAFANSANLLECYKKAAAVTGGAKNYRGNPAAVVCSGATSSAPAECFEKAVAAITGDHFSFEIAAVLCSGATSPNEPVKCLKDVYSSTSPSSSITNDSGARRAAVLCGKKGASGMIDLF